MMEVTGKGRACIPEDLTKDKVEEKSTTGPGTCSHRVTKYSLVELFGHVFIIMNISDRQTIEMFS